jgi:hypothetical protein
MSAFFTIKICHPGKKSPLLEAHFLQHLSAGKVSFEQNPKKSFDLQLGTFSDGVVDQCGCHSLAMKGPVNIAADLGRKPERHTAGTVRADTAPTGNFAIHFREKDGIFVRKVFCKP